MKWLIKAVIPFMITPCRMEVFFRDRIGNIPCPIRDISGMLLGESLRFSDSEKETEGIFPFGNTELLTWL